MLPLCHSLKSLPMTKRHLSRRSFLTACATVAAGGGFAGSMQPANSHAQSLPKANESPYLQRPRRAGRNSAQNTPFSYPHIYAARTDDRFVLPAIPYTHINPQYLRQAVKDPTGEKPGTIVIDRARRHLYLIQDHGQALRYGIGIGKDAFSWSGKAALHHKAAWPSWQPSARMARRLVGSLKPYGISGSAEPGFNNPLGARALCLPKRQGHILPPAWRARMVVCR